MNQIQRRPSRTAPYFAAPRRFLWPAIALLFIAAVWLSSLPPHIAIANDPLPDPTGEFNGLLQLLDDSGEFVIAWHTWGVTHAPGYPLLGLVGNLGVRLLDPLRLYPAAAANLLSFFFALGAFVLLARPLARFEASGTAVAAAYLLPAFGILVWLYAVVAEAYAFGLLLAFGSLSLALAVGQQPTRRKFLLLGLLFGLAVGHHRTLVFLAPALLLAVWPARALGWRIWLGAALLAAASLPGLPLSTPGRLGRIALGLRPFAHHLGRVQRRFFRPRIQRPAGPADGFARDCRCAKRPFAFSGPGDEWVRAGCRAVRFCPRSAARRNAPSGRRAAAGLWRLLAGPRQPGFVDSLLHDDPGRQPDVGRRLGGGADRFRPLAALAAGHRSAAHGGHRPEHPARPPALHPLPHQRRHRAANYCRRGRAAGRESVGRGDLGAALLPAGLWPVGDGRIGPNAPAGFAGRPQRLAAGAAGASVCQSQCAVCHPTGAVAREIWHSRSPQQPGPTDDSGSANAPAGGHRRPAVGRHRHSAAAGRPGGTGR
ncbi:MAG: DUF2723 domain-containing protein [Chloroflexi bacterium]|nr:DUF2723 domain-containing protein [Chloroflexota bacterium]